MKSNFKREEREVELEDIDGKQDRQSDHFRREKLARKKALRREQSEDDEYWN